MSSMINTLYSSYVDELGQTQTGIWLQEQGRVFKCEDEAPIEFVPTCIATLWDPSLVSDPNSLTLLEEVDFYEFNDVEQIIEEYACRSRTLECMETDDLDPTFFDDCQNYLLDSTSFGEVADVIQDEYPEWKLQGNGEVCLLAEKTFDFVCNPDDDTQCEQIETFTWTWEQELIIKASDAMTFMPDIVCDVEGDCPNVDRIKSILTQADWDETFPNAALADASYDLFLEAAGKFPVFCNLAYNEEEEQYYTEDELTLACALELSALGAHTIVNTNGWDAQITDSDDVPDFLHQGLMNTYADDCADDNNDGASLGTECYFDANQVDQPFAGFTINGVNVANSYPAYGPMAIRSIEGYYRAQEYLKIEQASTSSLYAVSQSHFWESGIGYWMFSDNRPSGHAMMSGYWSPSYAEYDAGIEEGFGATLAAYRTHECGRASKNLNLAKRAFRHLATKAGVWTFAQDYVNDCDGFYSETGDYPAMNDLDIPSYFDVNANGTCDRVDYPTAFSMWQIDSLLRCLEHAGNSLQ